MPLECCEGPGPRGAGWDEPDTPVVGDDVGGLELVDGLEVAGDGELWVGDGAPTDGTLTDGTLTDGTLTDGTLTDGTLTDGTFTDVVLIDGTGNDEESAGDTASDAIAPNIPAPSDAKHHFLPVDTD